MLWRLFKSVKLAVFLLIILAAVAILGTIIPQGEDAIGFAMKLNPKLFQVLSLLGLFDVYHTWWFRALLGLLSINLIVCSLDRFPKTWKRIRTAPSVEMEKMFEKADRDYIKGKLNETAKKIEFFLEKRFKKVRKKVKEKAAYFFIETGKYSQLGVYVVHLSIIVILIGGIIGSIWGFEGYMEILEGEKKDIVFLSRKMKTIRLPFYVKCQRFIVEYYKNGMPKEYISELVFIKDNKEVKRRVRVNHPVSFCGITFYQASYGISFEDKVYIKLLNKKSGTVVNLKLEPKRWYRVPNSDIMVQLVDIKEDFAKVGPVVILMIKKDKKIQRLILFKNPGLAKKRLPPQMLSASVFNPSYFKPYSFSIKEIPFRYYTGLQISRDPGVPFVWCGFIMLILGLIITFFTSHKRVWIKISEKENQLEIAIAGISSKDPVSLSKMIKKLLVDIKKEVVYGI